jgi:uncharacterized membrane protein
VRADANDRRFEHRLGRLLIAVTYVAVTLLLLGVVLLLVAQVSPLAGGPSLEPARLIGDVLALDPAGFLWLGLLAVIATPVCRVLGASVGFVRRGEPVMAAVSLAILGVIAIGVGVALAGA